ncbi:MULTISPECIES: DUF4198 domain-containing protein [Flavobacteriaceae]|uniref:DUF4198 domain-containing protein n=1 Tax=Flavobacteriaceae TaxID=49546 RepID=UPI001490B128|nr:MULTISPECIES: DUF4198 domain-containing protein [Allomuricauda]MDC6366716.1 DUF4198 domain-containing protein [Muricauda sp. AC10]
MKNQFLTILMFFFACISAQAHYLWIETQGTGVLGEKHEMRVHFGEYTYGVIEKVKGEAFPAVSKFQLWVIAPDGSKTKLTPEAKDDYYSTYFVPRENGIYTVVLNNDEIDVIDYTQYDFGIFKTHYHATAKVKIGKNEADTQAQNPNGIAIKQIPDEENIKLQILYKGTPIANQEVKIYVSDLWSKTLHTNEEGQVSFALPWETKYIVETTKKEEVPGTYNKKDYQFVWHCATYCIK